MELRLTLTVCAALGAAACGAGDGSGTATASGSAGATAISTGSATPATALPAADSSIRWPSGDAREGRKAFEALRCYGCHNVPGEASLAAMYADGPDRGPEITAVTATRPRLEILAQITVPGTDPEVHKSHMGSFATTMTVDQATDLVAFIESLAGEVELSKRPAAADLGKVAWPAGDADSGREVFKNLKCFSCHLVSGDEGLIAMYKGGPDKAPVLSAVTADRPPLELLAQIAFPGTNPKVRESHMGSFGSTMTLQDLTDLVAFIGTLSPPAPVGP